MIYNYILFYFEAKFYPLSLLICRVIKNSYSQRYYYLANDGERDVLHPSVLFVLLSFHFYVTAVNLNFIKKTYLDFKRD